MGQLLASLRYLMTMGVFSWFETKLNMKSCIAQHSLVRYQDTLGIWDHSKESRPLCRANEYVDACLAGRRLPEVFRAAYKRGHVSRFFLRRTSYDSSCHYLHEQ